MANRSEIEPNHFSDDDPLPVNDAKETSSVRLAIKAVPERPAVLSSESISEFAVLVGLRAPLVSNDAILKRAPVDLVTVLDVSGSMDGKKLDLVKQAVLFVIDNLGSCDRLSIVSFSTNAKRILRLTRMTDTGRQVAKQAVKMLVATAATDIVKGLKKGVQVLEERREKNPIASIIFLSDGNDNCNGGSMSFRSSGNEPKYLHLLPASIRPQNGTSMEDCQQQTFPVHAFGFGSDHDPIAMHAIADSSGGTFSFIESFVMVQDAFASCIGGLLTVVIQDLKLTARAASHGIKIKSIPSGRYTSKISSEGSDGIINVGDMYAEEEREFLIYLSIPPKILNTEQDKKMSILDITCRYKDAVSDEATELQTDLVEIQRLEFLSPVDALVNMDVDRQKNRLLVSESIAEAQKKAELKDFTGAQALLAERRCALMQSLSGKAGDSFCVWLESEIKETEERMANLKLYEESGRAFALAGMSAHASQRAGGVAGLVASSMGTGTLSARKRQAETQLQRGADPRLSFAGLRAVHGNGRIEQTARQLTGFYGAMHQMPSSGMIGHTSRQLTGFYGAMHQMPSSGMIGHTSRQLTGFYGAMHQMPSSGMIGHTSRQLTGFYGAMHQMPSSGMIGHTSRQLTGFYGAMHQMPSSGMIGHTSRQLTGFYGAMHQMPSSGMIGHTSRQLTGFDGAIQQMQSSAMQMQSSGRIGSSMQFTGFDGAMQMPSSGRIEQTSRQLTGFDGAMQQMQSSGRTEQTARKSTGGVAPRAAGYATRFMAEMVEKSQQVTKKITEDDSSSSLQP